MEYDAVFRLILDYGELLIEIITVFRAQSVHGMNWMRSGIVLKVSS